MSNPIVHIHVDPTEGRQYAEAKLVVPGSSISVGTGYGASANEASWNLGKNVEARISALRKELKVFRTTT